MPKNLEVGPRLDARFTRTNISRLLAKAWLGALPIGPGMGLVFGAEVFAEATALIRLSIVAIGIAMIGIGMLPAYQRWAAKHFGQVADVAPLFTTNVVHWRQTLGFLILVLLGAAIVAVCGYCLFPLFERVLALTDVEGTRAAAFSLTAIIGWTLYGVAVRASEIAVAWIVRDR